MNLGLPNFVWVKSPTLAQSGSYPTENKAPLFGRVYACYSHSKVRPMFRFDQLIRRDTIIRDVKQRHPETIPVFEELQFRTPCDDCDIETVARKNGLNVLDVVDTLNRAAFGTEADNDHAGNQSHP
jgi:hypothetical protein